MMAIPSNSRIKRADAVHRVIGIGISVSLLHSLRPAGIGALAASIDAQIAPGQILAAVRLRTRPCFIFQSTMCNPIAYTKMKLCAVS